MKTMFGRRTSYTVSDGCGYSAFLTLCGRQVPQWHNAAPAIDTTNVTRLLTIFISRRALH